MEGLRFSLGILLLGIVLICSVVILTILLGSLIVRFFEEDKIKNGSKVRIVKNSSSCNVVGDVGIISDWEQYRKNFTYRVNVKGRKDFGNWQNENHIEVLEY